MSFRNLLTLCCAAAAAAASDDVYILFDMEPGEGFNFRKKCISSRFVSFVTRLADDHPERQFVMVVPTFRNRQGHEEYPFSAFFDMAEFQKVFPRGRVIEVADFVQETGGTSIDSEVYFTPEWQNMDKRVCPDEKEAYTNGFYFHRPPGGDWSKHAQPSGWQVQIGGETFQVGELQCMNGGACMASEQRLRTLVWERIEKGATKLFLGGYDRISPAMEDNNKRFWADRRHLLYAAPIVAEAEKFVEAMPRRDFVSIHWRRKDFKRAHADTYTSAEEAARTLFQHCEARGTHLVFMATDDTSEAADVQTALQALVNGRCEADASAAQSACPSAEVLTYPQSSAALNPMQHALVEQLIASKGVFFLGTHHSTFSLEIHFARGGQGVDWNDADGSLTKAGKVIKLCDIEAPGGGELCEPWW